jgi:hypothetical protein
MDSRARLSKLPVCNTHTNQDLRSCSVLFCPTCTHHLHSSGLQGPMPLSNGSFNAVARPWQAH